MRNHLKKLLIFTCLALLVGVSGQALGDSNHSFSGFRMGVGARALGMGGAYVAIADDACAGYWNPAGLTAIENFNLSTMVAADMGADRKFNHIALGYNFGTAGWAAFSWIDFGISDIEKRDEFGNSLGLFNADEHGFLFSYGNVLNDLHVGATVKVAYAKIDDYSKTGVGFDLGLKYIVNENLHIGITAADLGTKVGEDKLPIVFRLGLGAYAFDGFTFAADVEKIQDESNVKIRLGSEYDYEFAEEYFGAIRAGVNDGAFAIGVGLTVMSNYSLDYAFVEDTEDFLGHNHRVSLTLSF
ncbi:MAG: PorV/PorQ family protein [candidate division Zixibacteria bacterium]|nr:PorV/PorQ family protein [candidate division Zixibacteria bacterium]